MNLFLIFYARCSINPTHILQVLGWCHTCKSYKKHGECNGLITAFSWKFAAEWDMESEANLMSSEAKKCISPGALKRDLPPSGNGARGDDPNCKSCQPPPSNPWNRGCSRLCRCRKGRETWAQEDLVTWMLYCFCFVFVFLFKQGKKGTTNIITKVYIAFVEKIQLKT